VVWTTTPWTLPANVAIAVDPKAQYQLLETQGSVPGIYLVARALHDRFLAETGLTEVAVVAEFAGQALVGSEAQHPFLDRTSRVIAADFVTMDTGTGQVHIAPGHGADDYVAGRANGLPVLSPVDDQGCLTEECGIPSLVGRYVFDANPGVIELLRERGALIAEHPYDHEYPHCWRSKTPVVFRAVEQFFIRIDAIRDAALAAVDATEWLPPWGRNRIRGTVESRPDWCISRQRTWGVPLPAFLDPDGALVLDPAVIRKVADLVARHGTNLWFERDDAWWAAELGLAPGTTRRNDTLDVWIDSGVSHRAVLRTHAALACPADVYIEATDQHRGWFQSSLMTAVALDGAAPYRTVITHGFVVDRDGKKISKSSSYQKPMDAGHFVGRHGADLVRLWVASVDYQNEVPFSEEAFTRLADAYRQFRNVLRILLANLYDFAPADASLDGATAVDRWMLGRLDAVAETCREAYAAYDFRKVYQTLNQFVTVDLSALYIDITKDRLYCDAPGSARRRASQTVLARVFDGLCRLLAPILAFTADEAWEYAGHAESVHLEQFPEVDPAGADPADAATVEVWLGLRATVAQAVEKARQAKEIGKAIEADVTLRIADPAALAAVAGREAEFAEFCILSGVRVEPGAETTVELGRSAHARCGRCWRHLPSVGSHADHADLCDRCAEVVWG
jgi:isoleucyl-tRNA synthetase